VNASKVCVQAVPVGVGQALRAFPEHESCPLAEGSAARRDRRRSRRGCGHLLSRATRAGRV